MERGLSKEGALGQPVDEREYLASQPPERPIEGALEEIQRRVMQSGRRVVVLDDDPTGVQSVHDVPVLTTWTVEDLRWALAQPSPTFYILTNSRSFPEAEAVSDWAAASERFRAISLFMATASASGKLRELVRM